LLFSKPRGYDLKEVEPMTDLTLAITVVVALVVTAAAIWFLLHWRRRVGLTERFGPEYQRTVAETQDRREAERKLVEREKRVDRLHIRPLNSADHKRYLERWRTVQARFVDDPAAAVREADDLIGEVMVLRGYPLEDFEQRVEDLSVDHPEVVQNYRAGHRLALRSKEGKASTEDLRQAMVHYRSLFDDLVEPEAPLREEEKAERTTWRSRREGVKLERKIN
jgi:hypothetical protein